MKGKRLKSQFNTSIGVILLLLLFGFSSCDIVEEAQDDEEESEPGGISLKAQDDLNLNQKLEAVVNQIPDFGGFFLNDDGNPVVYLLNPDTDRINEVENALTEVFGDDILERGDSPRRVVENPQLELREGTYTIGELYQWFERSGEVFEIESVVFTDLDERNNNLKIGINDIEYLNAVEQKLDELDIPREAVEIVLSTAPEAHSHDLSSNFSPTRSGIEIGGPGTCTFGFIGRNPSNRNLGFVTNSHCTSTMGTVSGDTFTNPSTGTNIGQETVDPSYSPCGFFRQMACRFSDSAFIRFNSSTSGNQEVARTQSWAGPNSGSGSTNIDHSSPTMNITGSKSHPVSGEMVDKVGRTTGWTYGFINRTCYRTRQNNNGTPVRVNGRRVLFLCQYRASYNSSDGDSGSPVFKWHGNTVTMVGINWGDSNGNGILSPMQGIQLEI